MGTNGSAEAWEHAQAEEIACWSGIRHKLVDPAYYRLKCDYWRRVLAKAGLDAATLAGRRVLEVGAGPSGIFLLFPDEAGYVALDPLMDAYRGLCPGNFSRQSLVSAKLEDYRPGTRADVVFAINCIDHCDSPEQFVARLAESCSPDGRIVLAVNCHLRKATARTWRLLQPVLEPHHPHHHTAAEWAALLGRDLQVVAEADIEPEVIWINHQTSDSAFPAPPGQQAARPGIFRRLARNVASGEILGKALFWLLAVLGLPPHAVTDTGRSIYRHRLFVLSPRKAT